MAASASASATNPYANNAQSSALEQDVLWEYAKLGDKVKRMAALARQTAETPNDALLADLRALEKKMGLVLTLYKASVWAVMMDSNAAAEAEAERQRVSEHRSDDQPYQDQDSLDEGF